MISEALSFIQTELNNYLVDLKKPADPSTKFVSLSNIVSMEEDGSSNLFDPAKEVIVLSLIHVEEERVNKAQRPYKKQANGVIAKIEPELRYNLYVLFAPRYDDYDTMLRGLDDVLDYFQENNVFDASEYSGMPARLQRLIMDIHTVSLEKSFEFWQSLGGKFQPAVMYKLRLLTYSAQQVKEFTDPIMGINFNAKKL